MQTYGCVARRRYKKKLTFLKQTYQLPAIKLKEKQILQERIKITVEKKYGCLNINMIMESKTIMVREEAYRAHKVLQLENGQ